MNMRDYGFNFEKLQDHFFPCDYCPYKSLCNSLPWDDPTPCEEQKQYNAARAVRLANEF